MRLGVKILFAAGLIGLSAPAEAGGRAPVVIRGIDSERALDAAYAPSIRIRLPQAGVAHSRHYRHSLAPARRYRLARPAFPALSLHSGRRYDDSYRPAAYNAADAFPPPAPAYPPPFDETPLFAR